MRLKGQCVDNYYIEIAKEGRKKVISTFLFFIFTEIQSRLTVIREKRM